MELLSKEKCSFNFSLKQKAQHYKKAKFKLFFACIEYFSINKDFILNFI